MIAYRPNLLIDDALMSIQSTWKASVWDSTLKTEDCDFVSNEETYFPVELLLLSNVSVFFMCRLEVALPGPVLLVAECIRLVGADNAALKQQQNA